MEQTTAVIILLSAIFLFLGGGLWIALSLIMVGVMGIAFFSNAPVGKLLATTVWGQSSEWAMTALPLFIWMGEVLFRTRLSEDMFTGLAPWVRRLPGRLLHINVIGSGIFCGRFGVFHSHCGHDWAHDGTRAS